MVVSELEHICVVFTSHLILPLSLRDHIYLHTWGCPRRKKMGGERWGQRQGDSPSLPLEPSHFLPRSYSHLYPLLLWCRTFLPRPDPSSLPWLILTKTFSPILLPIDSVGIEPEWLVALDLASSGRQHPGIGSGVTSPFVTFHISVFNKMKPKFPHFTPDPNHCF